LAADDRLDDEFRAFMLGLPGQEEVAAKLADGGETVDPDAVYAALDAMGDAAAARIEKTVRALYESRTSDAPYSPDAASAGQRALRNTALGWITRRDGGETARAQFANADNMTDSLAAMGALVGRMRDGAEAALAAFGERWKDDSLVLDKWYAMQAMSSAEGALSRVRALADDEAFNWRNPNKFRSLIAVFAANPVRFHEPSGAGYRFFADWLIKMDDVTPQTAARVAGAFETWRRYDEGRQALIRAELTRIQAKPKLSKDMGEIVGRILSA
ncbi:MAG: aminopeptidase N C-terminal domain-containing protein, partial [Pseudomonadota bacterium]